MDRIRELVTDSGIGGGMLFLRKRLAEKASLMSNNLNKIRKSDGEIFWERVLWAVGIATSKTLGQSNREKDGSR